MNYTFQEVSFKRHKTGKCIVCGKQVKLTEKFWGTINPFNKNEDGTIRTREDIWSKLKLDADEWSKKPIKHHKCNQLLNGGK